MTARFEIVQTNADQPWHVRIVGGNNEPILVGENLTDFDAARTAVLAVAEMFVFDPDIRGDAIEASGPTDWFISEGGRPTGVRIVYIDAREQPVQEPPC
jgi:hypothetical protein